MKQGVNGYKGLNKDTSYDSISKEYYIDAVDIRVTTTRGESMGSITNVKGNTEYFDLKDYPGTIPSLSTKQIIGVTSIRNRIILFAADNSGENGWIYELLYNETDKTFQSLNLIYESAELYFSTEHPIEAIGRYESDCYQRVYWTDYENYLRALNIADPDISTLDVGLVDIFPNIKFTQPLLTNVLGGGTLLAGLYQYAFRLQTLDGKQTLISPPGNLIHTSNDIETVSNIQQYNGNAATVNTGKAHEITIDTSAYSEFEKIELISIFHDNLNNTPTVTSVETKQINGLNTITFIHSGTETTEIDLTLDEYTFRSYPFKTPKTLVPKDNSLIVANIKNSSISLEDLLGDGESFDAKTARYNSSQVAPHDELTPEGKLKNAFNTSVDDTIHSISKPNIGYNHDAHWDAEWHTSKQFKYQSDGARLGGSGSNISYTFHLEPFVIDNGLDVNKATLTNNPITTHNLNDGYSYTNLTFDSNGSPFISGLLRGYKRGETYRFGIVFYTKKGEASFVQYIGDIKFPDISDIDSVTNNSGENFFPISKETTSGITTAYALGIEFTIDFSTCPTLLNNIESYQIVRLERTVNNTRRLCSGIMKAMHKIDVLGDQDNPTGGYDLADPLGEENIVHLFSYNRSYEKVGSSQGIDPTLPDLGVNGNFATINNQSNILSQPFPILGAFLTYYSPDISYNFDEVRTSINTNSCLLITGRYTDYYSSVGTASSGVSLVHADNTGNNINSFDIKYSAAASSESLGTKMEDHRRKLRTTGIVDKTNPQGGYAQYERGIEYIKKWRNNAIVEFPDNLQDDTIMEGELGIALGPYTGEDHTDTEQTYYIRNFYTYLGTPSQALNDPEDNTEGTPAVTIFHKGATGITGTIQKISTDPLDATSGLALTSNYDYYDTGRFPTPSYSSIPGPVACPTFLDGLTSTPIIDTMLPKLETYGGYTQDALESNVFIPASPVIDKTNTNPKVFGGDIFLNMFTLQEGSAWFWDIFYQNAATGASRNKQEYKENRTLTNTFVIESRVNIALAYGSTVKTGVRKLVNPGILNEIWRQETNNRETDYGKVLSMYENTYNEVYSRESKDISFFVKPSDFSDLCNTNDIRAYISNVKINEEAIDSWTQFGINNYYDVDDYGPINKIVNFRDDVHFFQDKGVGKYSINPRAIVSAGDGIATELGSGEGFQDHVYYSNEHGSIHQWGVKATDTAIYYFDAIHKKLFQVSEGNAPLSEMKGIHGFLNELEGPVLLRKENGGDNPILSQGIHISRDKVNDEVLFTFLGTDNKGGKKTLVYDELMQEFSSFYSATPNIWIENGDILLSPNPFFRDTIFQHNKGNWGEFYGIVQESSIKMVLNEAADINKILRFIEFNSIVRDDSKTIDRTQTITGFRIETEYQDTGKITDLSRIKRRFDKWRLKIPRNSLSSKKDRLRSTHFILTLYFDNSYNKELILNRVSHFFDIQVY
jgi:hypothetical protein